MTSLRTLALAGPVAALLALAGTTPANAAFSTAAALTPMGIGTATVQAPGSVKASVTCGRSTSSLHLSWTASATAGVSGYVVRIAFSDGYVQTLPAQTATTWTGSVDTYYVTATTLHMTVTAQTGYGWTKVSLPSAELSC